MTRQVVKEVPKDARQVIPSKKEPVSTLIHYKDTMVEGKPVVTAVQTIEAWPLPSNIARLVGEAKALPKGSYLRLTDSPSIALILDKIAWFASHNQVKLLQFGSSYYLKKA